MSKVARKDVDGNVIEWLEVPAEAALRGLEPHPEGGWYKRTWASPASVETQGGTRPAATMIEFLLPPGESSAWHLVDNDEIWLWHGPDELIIELGGTGAHPGDASQYVLGADATSGQCVQVLVPGGTWQRTLPGEGQVLVSCVVSPGFSFDDFALAE